MNCSKSTSFWNAVLPAAGMTLVVLLSSCTSSRYRDLQPLPGESNCILKFKPSFGADWYNTSVDVFDKHISGLLLLKTMPDSALRIVFTNEVGISFFDFEFGKGGTFKVHQVVRQLDKKLVIDLLRKDFETIIMQGITAEPLDIFVRHDEFFYALPRKKETDYFITNKDCATLLRIEKVSKRKKMTEMRLYGVAGAAPDSVILRHFKFDMQIALKKIQR